MNNRFLSTLATAVLLMLCSCLQRPDAGEFISPELGEVSVEVEEYMASLSCTVRNARDGESFGFIYSKSGGSVSNVSAVPENGVLKAKIKGLDAPAEYSVVAFVSNGRNEIISEAKSFSVTASGRAAVIPDPVFRRYCLENFDTNGDGKISEEEAYAVTAIKVCTDSIFSIKGIEFFPNLLEINARGGLMDGEWIKKGQLSSLDVSCNPRLRIIDCEDNNLREVDLSHNTDLIEINFSWNYLTSIDVTMLPRLTRFIVSMNRSIPSVDVTHNTKLSEYHGNWLDLPGLPDLTKCNSLHSIHIGGTGGGQYIDRPDYLSQWPELYSANIEGYMLEEIDLSGNPRIDGIWAGNMPNMEVFDLSPLMTLKEIHVNNCVRLRKIIVNDNIDINSLYIEKEGTRRLEVVHKSEMN